MQQKKLYTTVGVFVLLGMLFFVGIILKYAGQHMNTKEDELVVMYFEEPINGLSVGAQVLLQGLEIGQVEKINMIANLQEGTFKIPVYASITGKHITSYEGEDLSDDELLNHLIERGLRARLVSANFLTGQLNIELIMDTKQPAVLRGNGKAYEIPTVLSPYAKISKDLDEVPLQESLARFGNMINTLDEKLPIILANMSEISKTMNEQMPKMLKNSAALSKKLDVMFDPKTGEINKTMNNINATMEDVAKASRSIKNLTDYLERHPEAIIQGKEK